MANEDKTSPSCQLLKVTEVARFFSIHKRTVWRNAGLAEAGLSEFPTPIRLGPKTVRWRLADVQAYLAKLSGEEVA